MGGYTKLGFTLVICLVMVVDCMVFAQSKHVAPHRDTIRYCSGTIVSTIESDDNGQYHGLFVRYFRNGKPSEMFHYEHGILDGKAVYFFENGDTSYFESYKNGIQHGLCKAFYPNKKPMFAEQYFGGTLQNDCFYYDTSGNAHNGIYKQYSQGWVRKANCINGKPQGDMLVYGEVDCQLYQIIPFKEGLIEGHVIYYKNNGLKARTSLYDKGKYVKEDDSLYFENIKHYSNLLHFDSINPSYFYQRGLAYLRTGQKDKCLKDLETVTKLDPRNYKAFYNKGVILGDTLPQKAIIEFKKCNLIQPDFYIAHHNLGLLYFKQKDYKRAIEAFNKALLYKPEYLPTINYLGLIYDVMKDRKKASFYWDLAESIQVGQ